MENFKIGKYYWFQSFGQDEVFIDILQKVYENGLFESKNKHLIDTYDGFVYNQEWDYIEEFVGNLPKCI